MWKLEIIILGILFMGFCTGLHDQRAVKGFAEDMFNDGLLWIFEEGIPKYYSGVSIYLCSTFSSYRRCMGAWGISANEGLYINYF
jgi:hypothetical protein